MNRAHCVNRKKNKQIRYLSVYILMLVLLKYYKINFLSCDLQKNYQEQRTHNVRQDKELSKIDILNFSL